MSNFEKAAALSLQDWVDTLPKETEKYKHTPEYEKAIQKLFDKMRRNKFHKLTRKTARAILIAAILLLIATVALASTVGKDFVIKHFGSYATYEVVNNEKGEKVDGINIGYIPDGFECKYNENSDNISTRIYENNEYFINISKSIISSKDTYDDDYIKTEIIKGKMNYVVFDDYNNRGVIWNDGIYLYKVSGNISKEELLKIAQNIS